MPACDNASAGTIFTFALVLQVIRIAVPYALASLGGAITERSGTIDLAIEAKLLFGAFAAAAVAHASTPATSCASAPMLNSPASSAIDTESPASASAVAL